MAAFGRRSGVDERGAIVQKPAIVDEVQIARLQRQVHAQGGIVQHAVEHIKRLPLDGIQRLADLLTGGLDSVAQIAVGGRRRFGCLATLPGRTPAPTRPG